ncbi:MAG: pyridoxamine 5'-phosphate oxidase family protein [Candidatus Rokuibacteriota bacterium]
MAERLADARIQAFLATKEVVVLATVQSDGAPLATPMWFLHAPDALTMISVAQAQKVRNLRRDARVSVVAEAGTRADIRGVVIRGRAELMPDSPERGALTEGLLEKYHPHLEHRWGGRAMPPDRVMFRIVPERIHSWGLSPGAGT